MYLYTDYRQTLQATRVGCGLLCEWNRLCCREEREVNSDGGKYNISLCIVQFKYILPLLVVTVVGVFCLSNKPSPQWLVALIHAVSESLGR